MEQGLVFDVAHGSFTDGPGVRTVVFFKGCNLRCRWCHNPESQSAARQMLFYESKCSACGICKDVCPQRGEYCDLCGSCTQYCPSSAKKICGETRTVEEVMRELRKDAPFFDNSGGGVTFSGGECMLQPNFLKALLLRCRECGIHTAVDTAGNVDWERFEEILPYADMFLFDVKCVTPELHRKGTGVSNERILENLTKLGERFEGDIIVRVPIIPGFNTDEAELQKIAEFIGKIRCETVELLPYHKLGENKYAALGKVADSYAVPTEEQIGRIESIFKMRKNGGES